MEVSEINDITNPAAQTFATEGSLLQTQNTVTAPPSEPSETSSSETPKTRNRSAVRRFKAEASLQPNIQQLSPSSNAEAEILLKYSTNPKGWPGICYAAFLGHENAVGLFLKNGADVNSSSPEGTPLDLALNAHHLSLSRLLVSEGAKPLQAVENCAAKAFIEELNFLDTHGFLPKGGDFLRRCIETGVPFPSIKFLIERGADCKYRIPHYSQQTLCYYSSLLSPAVRRGDPELVELLIQHGAPINENLTRQTSDNPLMLAISYQKNNIAKILAREGAKLPLHRATRQNLVEFCAIHHRNYEMLMLLFDLGQSVDTEFNPPAPNSGYRNTLQLAVKEQKTEIVRELLARGANDTGALKIALQTGNREIINLLLQRGATIDGVKPNAPDKLVPAEGKLGDVLIRYTIDEIDSQQGFKSPLEKALWAGDIESFNLLKESGKFSAINGPLAITYSLPRSVDVHYTFSSWRSITSSPLAAAMRANDINAIRSLVSSRVGSHSPTEDRQRCDMILGAITWHQSMTGRIPYEMLEELISRKWIYTFPVIFSDKPDKRLIEIGLKTNSNAFYYFSTPLWQMGSGRLGNLNTLVGLLKINEKDSDKIKKEKSEIRELLKKHQIYPFF